MSKKYYLLFSVLFVNSVNGMTSLLKSKLGQYSVALGISYFGYKIYKNNLNKSKLTDHQKLIIKSKKNIHRLRIAKESEELILLSANAKY